MAMAATEKIDCAEVLSKKQQRSTLNAQRRSGKTAVKGLRNVISLPYETYEPQIRNEEDSNVIRMLKEVLVKLRVDHEKVPLSSIKGKSSTERKQLKSELQKKLESTAEFQVAAQLRSRLLLGVNAVSRGIHSAGAVLVSADTSPPLLRNTLLHVAATSKVPVLLLDSLKDICSATMGFACMTLGFKKTTTQDEYSAQFDALVGEVSRLWSQFPLPAMLQQAVDCTSGPAIADTPPTSEATSSAPRQQVETPVDVKSLHLKRPGPGRRAFIPGGSSSSAPKQQSQDFISLGGSSESAAEMVRFEPLRPTKQNKSMYKPLVIKRLKPNPNKDNKKKKKKKKTELAKN